MAPAQLRLSELSLIINNVLKDAFQSTSFWVIADVTNHTFKAISNYHYFELVEKDSNTNNILAKFSAKAWGNGARQIENFERITERKFTNDIQVLVNVTVDYHPTFGLQLQVNSIDPAFTLGAIEQQRLATLEKLVAENPAHIQKVNEEYSTRNKKLPLNHVLQNIAVISSRASAGLQDFKHTLQANPFRYTFTIDEYFTEVQGELNAGALRDTLIEVYNTGIAYDAVVITRGGGAQTDFLIFDNYLVGQAIARFPIPIITGIGHQKNTTIADLMAHTATKTPTKAAEFIIAHNRAFEEGLLIMQKSILLKAQQAFSVSHQQLAVLKASLIHTTRNILDVNKSAVANLSAKLLSGPSITISNKRNDLQNLAGNLKTFNILYIKSQQSHLDHYTSLVKLVSPINTLKRGFAIIKHNDKIINNASTVAAGDNVSIILADKEIAATVTLKKDYHGNEYNL